MGLRYLATPYHLSDQALPHFVTFHAADYGFDMLRDHLKGGGALEKGLAFRFGGRFARDAAQHLPALCRLLKGYDKAVREQFLAGAAPRLSDGDKTSLGALLGL